MIMGHDGTAESDVSAQCSKRRRLSSTTSEFCLRDNCDDTVCAEEVAGSSSGSTEQENLSGSEHFDHESNSSASSQAPENFSDEPAFLSDTMVALRLMLSQFPRVLEKVAVRPFVLKSQLYSSLKNRTEVDRELEGLRQAQSIRMFKLNTSQDDYALMPMNDYLLQVNAAEERMKLKRSSEDVAVFTWFKANVLSQNVEMGITHRELVSCLSQAGDPEEKHISLLINAGLLVRQLSDETAYWFSIPNVGLLLKNLTQGRKELLSFISRRRNKEILQSELERRRLRYSQLDMRFHLRDLLGSGRLQSVHTTVGPLIRIARD